MVSKEAILKAIATVSQAFKGKYCPSSHTPVRVDKKESRRKKEKERPFEMQNFYFSSLRGNNTVQSSQGHIRVVRPVSKELWARLLFHFR